MNIGFDLDRIFIDTPWFFPSFITNYFYYNKNLSSQKTQNKLVTYIKLFSYLPIFRIPLYKNILILNQLAKNTTYKFYLISGRSSYLKRVTDLFLEKNNIQQIFQSTYINNKDIAPHLFKDEMIKKNHIEIFVDDDLYTLLFLAKSNPEIKFIWFNPTKITIHRNIPENITVIQSFESILALISTYDKKTHP